MQIASRFNVSGKDSEHSVTCMNKVRGYCGSGMAANTRSRIFCRPCRFLKTKIAIYRTIIVSLLYWDETWSHVREEHMAVNISLEFVLKLGRGGVDWINLAQGRDK